eukprot:4670201-Pyramimonas_sp.AAC.1
MPGLRVQWLEEGQPCKDVQLNLATASGNAPTLQAQHSGWQRLEKARGACRAEGSNSWSVIPALGPALFWCRHGAPQPAS